ncbi:MAG: hypothetical protein Q8L23_15910 [Caulobacter sp.]|nr:hypothetical protein [Caulobacter sp.]
MATARKAPATPAAAEGPPPSEPGSAVITPPDRDGDGAPGGSDALQPYAVLLTEVAGLPRGVVVYGPAPAIAALIDDGQARAALEPDIALAGVHVHALPET